jgi:heme exporter protein B
MRQVSESAPIATPIDALRWACRRDLRLAALNLGEVALVLVFFLLVSTMFPLAMAPDPGLLKAIAPGIAWVSALLATLLSLSRLFAADLADGTLEQIVLAPAPLAALLAGKVLAHWITTALPLVLLSFLSGLQFGLDTEEIAILAASLLLGTPVLTWLGAISAALALGARGGSTLLGLLVLPLAVPVLIFGAGAVEAYAAGLGAQAHLSLLAAGSILASVVGPAVLSMAVRIAFE